MDERDRFGAFTEQTRKVLSLAQEEARHFQHNYIGTEHLLLGLINEDEGVAANVLRNLGVKSQKIRSAVEFILGRGDQVVQGEIGLTPRAKKVIELAVDEARRLHHHAIDTEHLLLGLVREGEGIAAGALESLGISLEEIRVQTIKALSLDQETPSQAEQQKSGQHISSHEALEQENDLGNTISKKRETSPLEVSQPLRPIVKDQSDAFTGQARNVQMGHFFIAYSRRDFYFAESLFYALHSNGINAWMDVWKITPGDDWENAITQAIQSAQGVILIATRESLQSPYVQNEICLAHQAQKPLYLVIRGGVSQKYLYIEREYPDKTVNTFNLYNYAKAIVDMRADFKLGVTKIADIIGNNAMYQKRLPGPFSFKIERILSIPLAIIFLSLVMAVTEVWKYGIGIVFEDLVNQSMGYIRDIIHGRINEILLLVPMTIGNVISIFVEITFILFIFRFLRRKRVEASDFFNVLLRDALGLGIIILIQDGGGVLENLTFLSSIRYFLGQYVSMFSVDSKVFILFGFHLVLFLLILILSIVFCFMYYAKGGQGAILRWLPTGKASQKIRYKGNEEWLKNLPDIGVSPGPSYQSYRIVTSPEDFAVAKEISSMLQREGHRVTVNPRETAECDLVILSPFADDSPLRNKNSGPVIYVLSRSMKLQKDVSIAIQWIDYRRPVEGQFWKQWERHFSQLIPKKGETKKRNNKKWKDPVFPYVPEELFNSILPVKYGRGILFTMVAVAVGSALLISEIEYLILLKSTMYSFLFLISVVFLLSAMILGYYTIAQMLRGAISRSGARRSLFFAGFLSIITAFTSQSRLLIVSSPGVVLVSMFTAMIMWSNIRSWLPPKSAKTNKKSLLQPITRYKAFTSSEYRYVMLVGLILVNALIVQGWVVPRISQSSSPEPYAVTVPGPYYLATPGLWSQDPLANAFGFHFTYQSDRLEVSQNQTTTGGYTWLRFSGTNAYPMQFAPHFRSSIHIQFTNNDPRTSFGMVFDDASRQQISLLAPGYWVVNGANTRRYSGKFAENEKAPDYTLEVEVNGILCIYKINGKEIATVANTSISSIDNILFMFTNVNPSGTRFYLSHFTYTPLPGPVLSRNEAIRLAAARNVTSYTTVAPGWNCNPNAERWNPFYEPAQVVTCTTTGTQLNRSGVFLDFDNNGFGGLPDAFDYSFDTTFQDAHDNQCLFVGTNATETTGRGYMYEFVICSDGTWATKYVGYYTKNFSVFLNNKLKSGHIIIKTTIAVFVKFRSMTQNFYINNQLVASYGAPDLQPAILSILFGNDKGTVMYSNFSFVPKAQQ